MNNNGSDGANEGNTNSSLAIKRANPAKQWCFVWNNYPANYLDKLNNSMEKCGGASKYIFGKEVGDSGTPHIQGYICFNRKIRAISQMEIKEIHWEKCKGNEVDNFKYCSKDKNYIQHGFDNSFLLKNKLLEIKIIKELKPWQDKIVLKYNEHCLEPNERSIFWIVDPLGSNGKTCLCKYLITKHDFGFLNNAKSADIAFYISNNMKNGYAFNFSRSLEDKVNYQAIESVKDGLLFSSKYESSLIIMNSPFIVCFSNFYPNISALSKDRWEILELGKDDEFKKVV